jgi:hypothetical protein
MRFGIVALVSALLLQSCAAINVATNRYLGVQPEPSVSPDSVKILLVPPAKYRQIGEIRLEFPGIRTEKEVLRDAQVQDALKRAAGRLGADGVVLLHFVHRVDGTGMITPLPVWLVTMAISTRPPIDRRKGILLTSVEPR